MKGDKYDQELLNAINEFIFNEELKGEDGCFKQQYISENLFHSDGRPWKVKQDKVSIYLKELRIRYEVKNMRDLRKKIRRFDEYTSLREKWYENVVSIDKDIEMLCIKTIPGNAHSVAYALEKTYNEKILGSISGNDFTLIITKKSENDDDINVFDEIKLFSTKATI